MVRLNPLSWLGEQIGNYPLRLSGGFAVLGGAVATALSVGPNAGVNELVSFASTQPAYAAAVVCGLAVMLFVDG
ncbi:hypothetical protein [Halosegnis longus]|uniref:hypothetical protein n=1 Tax=Halosegnis longus TaxID=2216012 RepID=UPI00129D4A1F|nr:hypothetical protein [Halosegnis longus]